MLGCKIHCGELLYIGLQHIHSRLHLIERVPLGNYSGRALYTSPVYSLILRSLSALVMTETEDKLIAAAAIIGESKDPVNG
ncbi:hypothetical protein GCM10007094_41150 [Pseudovibrio japonicus]|uniref:Uncharacterized protein n=1 Tax=Pseudovibrio japonicus TaxID=366534 RepID=A0ABQ3ENC2_9HYPH|nr:hypothetical protein GCM10007094_41150 [Pseudovibrio japonicus]